MKYSPLEDKSDPDSHPSEDYDELLLNEQAVRRKSILLAAIFVPITSLFLIAFGAWIGSQYFANPNSICPSHVQHYCKLLEPECYDAIPFLIFPELPSSKKSIQNYTL